ncbi:Permease [Pseudomonas putida]
MKRISGFIAGLLFGMGILLSGMANPAKVLGFLDIAGQWDPSLGLVMVGAIGAALLPMTWARRHTTALLGGKIQLPARRDIDRRLVGGSLVFGIGWGLAGVCPGPVLVLLAGGTGKPGYSCSRCLPVWECLMLQKRFAAVIRAGFDGKQLSSDRYQNKALTECNSTK